MTTVASDEEAPDLLVTGARIVTLDPARPAASAMLLSRGRIAALGGDELTASQPRAERLDLGGRVVIPGLIDAHAHFVGLGRSRSELDLRGARTLDEVVALVRDAASRMPDGEPILGRGWNDARWGESSAHHAPLSAATAHHPVFLRRVDGHATLANARAMEASGIGAHAPDPPGGEIVRDARGQPTGVFVDAATHLLRVPQASRSQLERWALAAQDACLAAGLTGVHDAGVDAAGLDVLESLASTGALQVRLRVMLEGDFDVDDVPAPWLAARLARGPGEGPGRLAIRAVKLFADGALGSHGAALLAPYADRPATRGLVQLSPGSLRARVRACLDAGFQVAAHAIGDAANRAVLDAFEQALGPDTTRDHRSRIEHAQVVDPADLPRFARLGVIASMQPTHATSDWEMAQERLGPARLAGAYAWRSLLDSGARLALGSDFPVEGENPFLGLFAACERTDAGGMPPGGWRPEQRLTRAEALRGFTTDAAFASFDESQLGSLAPGRHADFLVLRQDPSSCNARELLEMRPDETWIAGRRAWSASS